MAFADTGVNLTDPRLSDPGVLARAVENNVTHMLAIASTMTESHDLLQYIHDFSQSALNTSNQADEKSPALKAPLTLMSTAGVHPHYADDTNSQTWAQLKTLLADNTIVAVGECGLDFNRNFSSKKNQLYAFEQQLNIASEFGKGVYLHEREAFDEQIRLLEKYACDLKFMVAHCFTGNKSQMRAYLDLGCYIGITGWLCDVKRGSDLRKAVTSLPLDKLLLETDSPYLFPKTLKPRKSTNEPANLPYIARCLADMLGEDLSKIEEYAFNNALLLFFNRGLNDREGKRAN